MTEQATNEVGVAAVAQTDRETQSGESPERIAELEERVARKDAEIADLRTSIAGAVARYREAVLAATPGVPGDLVSGDTFEEIDESLHAAAAVVAGVRERLEAEVAETTVPAGAPGRQPADLSGLSGEHKIAWALKNQRR
jgi:hypothetical protein